MRDTCPVCEKPAKCGLTRGDGVPDLPSGAARQREEIIMRIMLALSLVFCFWMFPAQAASQEQAAFGNGSFEVGVDIMPGRYTSAGPKISIFPMCTFARLRTAGAGLMDLDEVIDVQIFQEGQAIVNIQPSDGGFYSAGCQDWQPRPPPAPPSE